MSIQFSNYGQERDINCTEEEFALFEAISSAFPGEDLRLTRVSDNYVTIRRGDHDVIRLKYTNKAKWLVFPYLETGQVKHYIKSVDEWTDYSDQIRDCLEIVGKYEV